MITYMYSGSIIPPTSFERCIAMVRLAETHSLPSLVRLCVDSMVEGRAHCSVLCCLSRWNTNSFRRQCRPLFWATCCRGGAWTYWIWLGGNGFEAFKISLVIRPLWSNMNLDDSCCLTYKVSAAIERAALAGIDLAYGGLKGSLGWNWFSVWWIDSSNFVLIQLTRQNGINLEPCVMEGPQRPDCAKWPQDLWWRHPPQSSHQVARGRFCHQVRCS